MSTTETQRAAWRRRQRWRTDMTADARAGDAAPAGVVHKGRTPLPPTARKLAAGPCSGAVPDLLRAADGEARLAGEVVRGVDEHLVAVPDLTGQQRPGELVA